ncbi:MAG: hypothetical protein ACYC6N_24215 [Pirellulaceae bacterium]
MRQNAHVAKRTAVIPADRKSLRKSQEGLEQRVAGRAARLTQANEQLAAAPASSVRSVATMLRVVLFSHTDGVEKEGGYIEFTELLVEHVNDWAYRCQPSGILTFEQVKGIVEILLWSEANSGTVGDYRWEKMARTQT